ncbi:MAG: fibronectin type III domain-containing protein [Acidimicrobiales bacterium]|nr:fibronectin type III domain-containing protein [Acidimicrobiales bacterium]
MRVGGPGRRRRAAATLTALALAAGVLTATAASTATAPPAAADNDDYVALGDSYTSGPLIPDQTGQPLGCLRSDRDYPRVVARVLGLSLTDVSCSGAETPDMANSQGVTPGPNPPQFDALSADTDVVTVQIGGNDIGFSEIVRNCVALIPLSAVCQPDYVRNGVDQISNRIAATAPKVAAVVQGIRARAPHARVYVVGYPAILPESGGGCWPSLPLSDYDLPWLRDKNRELNVMLATQAVANGARYVDLYTPGIGHDACQDDGRRWVEPIIPSGLQAAPVHPNARGMEAMGQVVAARIAATPNLPSAPEGLTATPGDGQVALSWQPPADDGGGAINGYRVFRNGALVHTTADGATRAFTDTGRANGTNYAYAVAAVNAAGPGPLTPVVLARPVARPAPPVGLTAVAGDGEVQVSWSPPPADGGSPITGYRLYRDDVAVDAVLGAGARTYLDESVDNGRTYGYQVAAVNAVGESARSAVADATPEPGFTCCPDHGYTDVPDALDGAVDWATWYGVAPGFADDTFRPGRTVKRKQVVAMLWHLMDEPSSGRVRRFPDVPATAPYVAAADWAVDQRLVAVGANGSFRPRGVVTRAQLVVMVWKLVGRPTVATHHAYTDTRSGAFYQPALDWAASYALAGADGGAFRPKDRALRGDAAAWLYNLAWTDGAWSATGPRPDAILF